VTYRTFEIFEKSINNPQKDNSLLGNVIYDFIKKMDLFKVGFPMKLEVDKNKKGLILFYLFQSDKVITPGLIIITMA
jgi:hypothetical protein